MLSWICGAIAVTAAVSAEARVLRVCADPDNLPFSNQRGEGIENGLAELLARALNVELQYTWWSERRFFLRNSLNAGECDAVMEVPEASGTVAVTRPYYRSYYVFVSRPGVKIASLDDPRLRNMRIGLNIAGEDFTPPGHALASRGLAGNLVGYRLYGGPGRIVDAVRRGDIGTAIVWGPLAGYFAQDLEIAPVEPASFQGVPFDFGISIAVRKSDTALRDELDRALVRECAAVRELLGRFHVPGKETGGCAGAPLPLSGSSR